IRLLQLSTVELNQELERYLAENPLLERADLAAAEESPAPAPNGAEAAPGTGARRDDDERDDFTQFAAAEPTLQEHLLQQISLTVLTPRDKLIAEFVLGHLDEDGYLKQDLEELRESAIAAMSEVEIEELQIALRHVQNLEPTGVGARDVAECLELQLKALPESTPHRDTALRLVTQHLDVLAARDFNRLKRLLGVTEDE